MQQINVGSRSPLQQRGSDSVLDVFPRNLSIKDARRTEINSNIQNKYNTGPPPPDKPVTLHDSSEASKFVQHQKLNVQQPVAPDLVPIGILTSSYNATQHSRINCKKELEKNLHTIDEHSRTQQPDATFPIATSRLISLPQFPTPRISSTETDLEQSLYRSQSNSPPSAEASPVSQSDADSPISSNSSTTGERQPQAASFILNAPQDLPSINSVFKASSKFSPLNTDTTVPPFSSNDLSSVAASSPQSGDEEESKLTRLSSSLLHDLAAAAAAVGETEEEETSLLELNGGGTSPQVEQRRERFPPPPVGTLEEPEHYGINLTIGGELVKSSDVAVWEFPDMAKLRQLRDRLVCFMTENHLKQADICRFTGLGAPYLSFMVKDPTISNFSPRRRVEVYSVLKAFFRKIDHEEVTLDDIARLVLMSKATARAANSRKRGAGSAAVRRTSSGAFSQDEPGTLGDKGVVRRRRRGRPRTLDRISEDGYRGGMVKDEGFSFDDYLTSSSAASNTMLYDAISNVTYGGDQYTSADGVPRRRRGRGRGRGMTRGVAEEHTRAGDDSRPSVPWRNETKAGAVISGATDVLAQTLLPLFSNCNLTQLTSINEALQNLTLHRLLTSAAGNLKETTAVAGGESATAVEDTESSTEMTGQQTLLFNELVQNILTQSIDTAPGEDIDDNMEEEDEDSVSKKVEKRNPEQSANASSSHDQASGAEHDSGVSTPPVKCVQPYSLSNSLPQIEDEASHGEVTDHTSFAKKQKKSSQYHAPLSPNRKPPILGLLPPANVCTTDADSDTVESGDLTSNRLASLVEAILDVSNRANAAATKKGYHQEMDEATAPTSSHLGVKKPTERIYFGRHWRNEVDIGMVKSPEESAKGDFPMADVSETTRTSTDDDDEDDSEILLLLPSSGKVCPIRIKWSHAGLGADEDIIWDLMETGPAVEAYVETYLRELPNSMSASLGHIRGQLVHSFREQLEARKAFENMFDAVTGHLSVMISKSHLAARLLPGMTRKILLDCFYNGIRVIDAVPWNLMNSLHDIKDLLKSLVRDLNLPSAFISTMFPAFLRAVTREKLKFIHECGDLLMGNVQDEIAAQSIFELRLVDSPRKRCLDSLTEGGSCPSSPAAKKARSSAREDRTAPSTTPIDDEEEEELVEQPDITSTIQSTREDDLTNRATLGSEPASPSVYSSRNPSDSNTEGGDEFTSSFVQDKALPLSQKHRDQHRQSPSDAITESPEDGEMSSVGLNEGCSSSSSMNVMPRPSTQFSQPSRQIHVLSSISGRAVSPSHSHSTAVTRPLIQWSSPSMSEDKLPRKKESQQPSETAGFLDQLSVEGPLILRTQNTGSLTRAELEEAIKNDGFCYNSSSDQLNENNNKHHLIDNNEDEGDNGKLYERRARRSGVTVNDQPNLQNKLLRRY